MDKSEYLIYLACPDTLDSSYCTDEIRHFKEQHQGKLDNIIVLLLEGKPEEVFPQELCYEGCWEEDGVPDSSRKAEVHWLDLRGEDTKETLEKLNESLLMVAAPLLHCELDELVQRDQQWKKRKRLIWGTICSAVSVVVLCTAYTLWLTWSMDYKRQAENALADGDDNRALFYYAKNLSLNPFSEETRINVQLLLQKKPWPAIIKKEEGSTILAGKIYSEEEKNELGVPWDYSPLWTTGSGDYEFWTGGYEKYYFVGVEADVLEELSDIESIFNTSDQHIAEAWCFKNKDSDFTAGIFNFLR